MVNQLPPHPAAPIPAGEMDRTFAALADPTRRAIVARLAEAGDSGVPVGALAEPFEMSLPAVSKHVRVLERAGLLTQRRAGRTRLCRLAPRPLRVAHDWLADYRRFWSDRLDALTEFLEAPPSPARDSDRPGQGASRD